MKRETHQPPMIDPEKIHLTEIVILKNLIDSTDAYLEQPTKPEKVLMQLDTNFWFEFENTLSRFRLNIKLEGQNEQAEPIGLTGEFLLDFHFQIENLLDFITQTDNGPQVERIVGGTMLGIGFSTARGIVMERTKGTPFAGFILPVINPMKTLFNSEDLPKPKPSKPVRRRKLSP